ncbi:capsule biosynthesis protein CapG [Pasteurellaceae bacterium 15-036681]|nr:capsule biosynthesis protein CapG [Pasteurellaceae bacterium 15-036681]
MLETKNKIDFVITWVDGNDPIWKKSKEVYAKQANIVLNSDARYRDWELLKYWFRSVEKHASWVNQIFFVTEGHIPKWINIKHPKLKIIKHNDYINSDFLPTFSANPIEWNYHNIKELSQNFVNFNDDMFINDDVTPNDFFINGIPRDSGIFSPIVPNFGGIASMVLNNIEIINKYFNQREVLYKNLPKFFNLKYGRHLLKNICVLPWRPILGFYDNHIPISYDKNYFIKAWENEKESIENTCKHRFRQKDDITHWLVRYWQLCEGHFIPRDINFGQHYSISDDIEEIETVILQSKYKTICLNDGNDVKNFDSLKERLTTIFEKKYNEKSQFEN